MSKVFLSHNTADKPFARRLAGDLRHSGHTVWIDEAEILVGDSLIEKIREGLDEVDYVAAVLSAASIQSAWVQRELDIAANREIAERRVLVLPILLEDVELPGFLMGKRYADFRNEQDYQAGFDSLLASIGRVKGVDQPEDAEIVRLRAELADVKAVVEFHAKNLRAHERVALQNKSVRLAQAIEQANVKNPTHAPINNTYAFEYGDSIMTLDYLLWCIAKVARYGPHPVEVLLSIHGKWGDAQRMIEAYEDMLESKQD